MQKISTGKHDLSITLVRIADVFKLQGDIDSALTNFREALQIREKLAEQNPKMPTFQLDLSWGLEKLGGALYEQGNVGHCLECYQRSLPMRENCG